MGILTTLSKENNVFDDTRFVQSGAFAKQFLMPIDKKLSFSVKCPNCLEHHKDINFENYCDPCYNDIYLSYNEDPNTDSDIMIIKSTNLPRSVKVTP